MQDLKFDVKLIYAILNGKISHEVDRKLVNDFKRHDIPLNVEQWSILLFLQNNATPTQQELSDSLFISKPNITRLINKLEKKGFVQRTIKEEDKRCNTINITKKGIKITEKAMKTSYIALHATLKGMKVSELRTAQELLLKIFNNISEYNFHH